MRSLLLLILSMSMFMSTAQVVDWAVAFQGTGNEGREVRNEPTPDGGVVVLINSIDTIDTDPGSGQLLTGSTSNGIILVKLGQNGGLIWSQALMDGGNSLKAFDQAIDSDGNVIIVGRFSDTLDFDPGSAVYDVPYQQIVVGGWPPFQSHANFVLKLSSEGHFIWVKTFAGSGFDEFSSLAIDENDQIIVSGTFQYNSDFDPGPDISMLGSVQNSADVFILKLSESGNLEWVRNIGGESNDFGSGVNVDENGHVYVKAKLLGETIYSGNGESMDTVITAVACGHAIFKFDPSGNLQSVFPLVQCPAYHIASFQIDDSLNIILAGHFSGTIDLDPGPDSALFTSISNSTIFIQKLDSNGQYLWGIIIPSYIHSARISDLELDTAGHIFISGYFTGTVDFDAGIHTAAKSSLGYEDGFLSKYTEDGQFDWVRQIGSFESDYWHNISCSDQGIIYGSGSFNEVVDFSIASNPILLDAENPHTAFLVKFGNCSRSYGNISITGCSPYISPSGRFQWLESNTYSDTITNHLGCDSVLTIDLTIHEVNTQVLVDLESLALTSAPEMLQYQWLDCLADHSGINGASGMVFQPSQSGSYAVILVDSMCTDTSSCFNILLDDIGSYTRSLSIYPNPTNGLVSINVQGSGFLNSVQVYSLNGQLLIESEEINSKQVYVTLPEPKGCYMVKVGLQNGSVSWLRTMKL